MTRPAGQPPFAQVISLHDAANDRLPIADTPVIPARHGGRCYGCNGAIRVAEEIQRVDGRWHHVECIPGGSVERWGRPAEAA